MRLSKKRELEREEEGFRPDKEMILCKNKLNN